MKNPFKKSSIIDTAVNVGVGGAANVAMDYVFGLIPAETLELSSTVKNAIKIGVGVLGGTMLKNKFARAAVDGIAIVGVSDIVSGLVNGDGEKATTSTDGVSTMIGRVRPGNRYYRRSGKVGGVNEALS